MTTLTEFLESRLREDEERALQASPSPWHLNAEHDEVIAVDDIEVCRAFALSSNQQRNTARFIAEHDPARVLREVTAKRAIVERESKVTLPEWKPDCGGDWVLSGTGFFANYWPDNTVSASITDGFDGPALADSGIVPKESRAACQLFAEEWIRQHLPERCPILRDLASAYSNHRDYQPEWSTT
ncbi:DUF6221 family protein [Glycomyces sp. NPDC021274]|uniref:DUF6221 family protein n=1 Tax=Glycomyces sp. NPDC021274 TaxID=3155120 RepID=UPI0033DCA3B8